MPYLSPGQDGGGCLGCRPVWRRNNLPPSVKAVPDNLSIGIALGGKNPLITAARLVCRFNCCTGRSVGVLVDRTDIENDRVFVSWASTECVL